MPDETIIPKLESGAPIGNASIYATQAPSELSIHRSATQGPFGQKIGRYSVVRVLGEGAFGTVLLAHDDDLQRAVAIKVPRRDRFLSMQDASVFMEEARTVARLRLPGIVAVYDVGRTDDGFPFVVLEFIDGPSLESEMRAGPVSPRRAAQLLAAIADAVAFAHKQGFVHRDLKPANILLDGQGIPHVSDFGLALHESQQIRRKGEYAGTAAYMSPEQIRGESHRLDGRTDIWALGVILYHLLTRRLPFGGTTLHEISDEIQHRDPKPPRQIDDAIPAELVLIIDRCCQKKISDRYSTASDLAADLRLWLGDQSSGSFRPSVFEFGKRNSTDKQQTLPETVVIKPPVSNIAAAPLMLGTIIPLSLCAVCVGLIGVFIFQYMFVRPKPATAAATVVVPDSVLSASQIVHAASANAPLTGTLDVLVWNKQRGSRGVRLRDPAFHALRHDDQVRVEARMNRQGYLYILWIDSAGKVQPLYPWEPGDWDRRPTREKSVQEISLPEQADLGWPIEGSSGMETLVLMARESPFSDGQIRELRSQLNGLPKQPAQNAGAIVDFLNGQIVSVEQDRNRGPKLFDPQKIDDPLLQTQARLQAAVADHVLYLRAVSFANQGTP